MICMVNGDTMLKLNDMQVQIGQFWTFLGGNNELIVNPLKEILEEVGAGVGTDEVICRVSKYQNFFFGLCLKDVEKMVYAMIDQY